VSTIRRNKPMSQANVLMCGIGITCLIANSIVLYISFLWAYFSNNYIFSARINDLGEAHLEFILLPLSIILGLYAAINLFRYMPKKADS